MGSFIARQPNGLLCRFSTVADTVTHYNMTDEEYIEMYTEKAREEAKDILQRCLRPFDEVKQHFAPINMTRAEFNKLLREMGENNIRQQNCSEGKFCAYCKYYQKEKNTYACKNECSELFNKDPAPFQTCRHFLKE